MHVISEKPLRDFGAIHSDARKELQAWFRNASNNDWTKFAGVREVYTDADQVGKFTVFNICRNKYRLIVSIHYNRGKLYVRHVLTHAEYNLGTWKQEEQPKAKHPEKERPAKDKPSHEKKASTRRKRR